jgi:hypothetical protein
MHKPQGYAEFQDAVFRELKDLEFRRNRIVIERLMESYGLTWDEVTALYVEGMDGRRLNEAMWDARKKTPTTKP